MVEQVLFSKLCGFVAAIEVAVVLLVLFVKVPDLKDDVGSHLFVEEVVFPGLF